MDLMDAHLRLSGPAGALPAPAAAGRAAAADRPGAAVLDAVEETLRRFVVFPTPHAAVAVALWAAATHAAGQLEFAPRLVVRSPVKRCGKSRLMELLRILARHPLASGSISAAALVRSISEDDPPTLLLDEADTVFGKGARGDEAAEHLRGVLNLGFARGWPYTRWDPAARRAQHFPTFALAALAGIGPLPDTIEDRAVVVAMRRKSPADQAAKFRARRDTPRVQEIARALAGWVLPLAGQIGAAEPAMPAGLNDRAEDVWEPLLAVADAAGGRWPRRARDAAVALSGDAGGPLDGAAPLRLLADLRQVFGEREALWTRTILAGLHAIGGAPWANWHGQPLDARGLAALLKPFGVASRDVREGGYPARNLKGYERSQLAPLWQDSPAPDA